MDPTRWRWRRAAIALVLASGLFALFLQVPLSMTLNLSDPRDSASVFVVYPVFASLVFWLFARPRKPRSSPEA